ncbi:hypothetical protein BLOT_008516 [Blomia tropicalis]|nr:hypothetical protein BLOT_008516 [Blomia tropicalis]
MSPQSTKTIFVILLQLFIQLITYESIQASYIRAYPIPPKVRLIDPLDHKHIPLVIPEKLEYQRELVKAYGSLDALGTIHQMPNGAIDTRDFGKNIHDRKIGRIKPDEKKWALRKLENQLAETLARALWKQLRIMKNTAIAKFSPVIVFP